MGLNEGLAGSRLCVPEAQEEEEDGRGRLGQSQVGVREPQRMGEAQRASSVGDRELCRIRDIRVVNEPSQAQGFR